MIFIADKQITREYLQSKKQNTDLWIRFSREAMQLKFEVFLYSARNTDTKYIYIKKNQKKKEYVISIRFSDHPGREHNYAYFGKPDFFVYDEESYLATLQEIESFNRKYFPREYQVKKNKELRKEVFELKKKIGEYKTLLKGAI